MSTASPSPDPPSAAWFTWTIPPDDPAIGRPLGKVLRHRVSLRLLRRLKATGGLLVNGQPHHTDYLCQAGDQIQLIGDRVAPAAADSLSVEPESLPLRILYEDHWLLAVDKPAGQLTHPVRRERRGTVANAVAAHWPGQAAVHPILRLDRQTSGLLLFAANPLVHQRLQAEQLRGELHKAYLAVVERIIPGRPAPSAGIINWPLAPVPDNRGRHQIASGVGSALGRPACTRYRCLQLLPPAKAGGPSRALLLVEPVTGRTHQIRLHLAACGWPIAGDPLYGSGYPAARMALHAWRLTFRHPFTGNQMELEAPLPADWPLPPPLPLPDPGVSNPSGSCG